MNDEIKIKISDMKQWIKQQIEKDSKYWAVAAFLTMQCIFVYADNKEAFQDDQELKKLLKTILDKHEPDLKDVRRLLNY